jgi:Na+-transporting NADH:ubiquinone oxidoreductase subunit NqrD
MAVAGTQSGEQAFFLGSVCLVLIIANSLASYLCGDLLQYRIPVWALSLGTAFILAGIDAIFAPKISRLPEQTRIVMYLLAASPAVFSRARSFSHGTSPGRALFDSAGQGVGILLVMLAVSLARELLGGGRLAGSQIFISPPWPVVSTVFGGLIMTALAVFIFKATGRSRQ